MTQKLRIRSGGVNVRSANVLTRLPAAASLPAGASGPVTAMVPRGGRGLGTPEAGVERLPLGENPGGAGRAVVMDCLMANLLMRVLDPAFGHPRGLAGRVGGALMVWGNAEQERWAVERTELRPGDEALVVGHGPGLGVELAAAAVGPTGSVVGVDPSATMRQMAAARNASAISAGIVQLREGTAERTGCTEASVDVVTSVNNVMLWDLPAGFAELWRVLRPAGRLVLTVHKHVLGVPPQRLRDEATDAGFVDVALHVRARRLNSPAVEMMARRPAG